MRNFSLVTLSLLIAACASPAPPEPPLPITSHAVTAADYPVESISLREVGTTQVQFLVHVDGAVRDTIIARSSGSPRLDQAAIQTVSRWLQACHPERPASPSLAGRERRVSTQVIRRNFVNP